MDDANGSKFVRDYQSTLSDPEAVKGYVLQQEIKRKVKKLCDEDVSYAIELISRKAFNTKRRVYEFIDERVDAITSVKRLQSISELSTLDKLINELKK